MPRSFNRLNLKRLQTESETNEVKDVKKFKGKSIAVEKRNQDLASPGTSRILFPCNTKIADRNLEPSQKTSKMFNHEDFFREDLTIEEEKELDYKIVSCDDLGALKELVIRFRERYLSEIKVRDLVAENKEQSHKAEKDNFSSFKQLESIEIGWKKMEKLEADINCSICDEVMINVRFYYF